MRTKREREREKERERERERERETESEREGRRGINTPLDAPGGKASSSFFSRIATPTVLPFLLYSGAAGRVTPLPQPSVIMLPQITALRAFRRR